MTVRIRADGLGSVISENNRSKYFIEVLGCTYAIAKDAQDKRYQDVRINGVSVIPSTFKSQRGINALKFDSNFKVIDTAWFDTYALTSNNQSMLSYIDNTAAGHFLCMFSVDSIRISDTINIADEMPKRGANWYPKIDLVADRFGWSGIYSGKSKKFHSSSTMKYFSGTKLSTDILDSDQPSDYTAYCCAMADTIDDLGIRQQSGFYEFSEKSTAFKYIDNKNIVDYGATVGALDEYNITFDMLGKGSILLSFYNNTTLLSSVSIADNTLVWTGVYKLESRGNFPKDCNKMTVQFVPDPTVTCKVRNFSMGIDTKTVIKPAMFTPNGIPIKNFAEGTLYEPLNAVTAVRLTRDYNLEALGVIEDGGYYCKIFEHTIFQDPKYPDEFFKSKAEADNFDGFNKFSKIGDIKKFKYGGKYRFRLVYPGYGRITWEQTAELSDVIAEGNDKKVAGFKLIENTIDPEFSAIFVGLREADGTNEVSVYSGAPRNTASAYIAYSVGCKRIHQPNGTGIPGPFIDKSVNEVRLYVWVE